MSHQDEEPEFWPFHLDISEDEKEEFHDDDESFVYEEPPE